MVKSVISIFVAAALICCGAFWENRFLVSTFNELTEMLDEIYLKLDNETAVADDVLALQKFWISKKEKLHIFIPHTEIKELDLWIAECVTYTKFGKYEDAMAKTEVVKELCEQIPKSFLIRIENLM